MRVNRKNDNYGKGAIEAGRLFVDTKAGRVYSMCVRAHLNERIEIGSKHPFGYVILHLGFKGSVYRIRRARLVWIAEYGDINPELWIDHINRIRDDDRIENLRLVTPKENAINRPSTLGENGSNAKLTTKEALEIKHFLNEGMSHKGLAKRYNVHRSTITAISTGRNWKWL